MLIVVYVHSIEIVNLLSMSILKVGIVSVVASLEILLILLLYIRIYLLKKRSMSYHVRIRDLNLEEAQNEIDKLMAKGIDRSDVALLVLSWGTLSDTDLETAIWYLHDWKGDSEIHLIKGELSYIRKKLDSLHPGAEGKYKQYE
jgi:hypothetical protein